MSAHDTPGTRDTDAAVQGGTTPATTRVVFAHSLDGLLRGLGDRLTARCRERLSPFGFGHKPPLPAYEVGAYYQMLEILAEEVFPELPRPEAYLMLGRAQVAGYVGTALGSAVFQVLRLIGTRRALQRLTRAYRSANSFTRAETVILSQNEARVRITPRMPHREVHSGILERGLEEFGERSVQVALEGFEGPDGETAIYRVAWGAAAQAPETGAGAGTR